MKESTFWENLAKLVSNNTDGKSCEIVKHSEDDYRRETAFRDASVIFGKSEKEIQRSFEELSAKLRYPKE